nr:TPA_asm: L [Pogostemom alphacytorhabdovirus 1_Sol]
MMTDMESFPRPKRFDPLPDFHLQNPLYTISDKLQKWRTGERLPVRLYKSLKALGDRYQDVREGNPIKLKRLLEFLVNYDKSKRPTNAIEDVIHRLKLDAELSDRIDLSELETAFRKAVTQFPLKSWALMKMSQELLLALNTLSSRRPIPNGWIKVSDNLYQKNSNGYHVLITPSLLGLSQSAFKSVTVFDGDWLRSVVDIFTERYLIRFATRIGRHLNPNHYPVLNILERVIKWGDEILDTFGNRGFKLIKAYEAIVIGVLQSKSEGTFLDNSRFLNNTLADLSDEAADFGRKAQELVSILEELRSPHHLTQLYGLHRIWGHPLVNPKEGMLKMLKIGQKDILEPGPLPLQFGIHFKKMFAKSFREKKGIYPLIIHNSSELASKILQNEDWNIISRSDYDREWECLHFDKNFEIPESFNLSMIVADKSVSPTLSELKLNVQTRRTVMNAELRRGVLRWINHESIDPREFLKQVAEGQFPQDHKVIGLRSKERELNPTPRMFALMSHLMRVYVVVTESMLSEHILPHFPQITMTDDLLSLTKKTYTTVRNQARNKGKMRHRATKTICMSLDFEKWNGHMRQEGTLYVFKELGNLFGKEDLYHVTYDIFKESYFYLADGSYVPSIDDEGSFTPDPPSSFTGHKGGQEGLRQKGWTIFTVVGLDMICSRHNVSYKIMGMGDNQVLQLTFSTHKVDATGNATERGLSDMKRTLKSVFNDLLETFNSLGLPLKPLETWMSEDLFLYGKYPVWQGVPLTMDLKKIMRIFPYSNEEIMTTENILNTIAANAQAATQSSPNLGLSYIIGLLMMSEAIDDILNYHPLLGKGLRRCFDEDRKWSLTIRKTKPLEIQCADDHINERTKRRVMMLIPRILGGYVSFSIFGLLMRGFPDPLSSALSLLYAYKAHLQSADPVLQVARMWMTPIYMPDRSFKLLTEDVSSVNLLAPVTPTAGLRREVENYLSSGRTIRNKEFKDLMTIRNAEVEEVLAEALCRGGTLHIRLIHDILESTVYGYVKSIISKVTKSSTILGLAVDKSRRDPLSKVIDNEANYYRFFTWRSSCLADYELPKCPTVLAKRMRKEGWGKELVGVTVAFPFSYLIRTNCHDRAHGCTCTDGYISVFLNESEVTRDDWDMAIGKSPPYLGSMTKEKVLISSGMRIYSGEPLIRRPINLMRVIGWFVPEDSNTAEIIKSCVAAVSDINPNLFRGITEGTSGSEIHRYRDTSLKHGALCSSNYLYSTRYHISTDTFSRYAKGSQNYDMMFQANLCAILESTHLEIVKANLTGSLIPKVYHFKQCCYECINPLDEVFHDIESPLASKLIPSKKTNSYLYVPHDKISMVLEHMAFADWVTWTMSSEDFLRLTNNFKVDWLSESVVDNILIDFMSSGSDLTYVTSSLLDIKEHNRLFYLTVKPKDIYYDLCARILMISEWRCLNLSSWKTPTAEAIIRTALAFVNDLPSEKFAGMSGFFTWPEKMQSYYFSPEISEPETIPVTIESACKAIRASLVNLLTSVKIFPQHRTSHIFVEETKNSKLILKMMIYDQLKMITSKWCCLRRVASSSPSDLCSQKPDMLVCSENHVLFPRGIDGLIGKSQVSMDALKKSISEINEAKKGGFEFPGMRPLERTSCCIAYSSARMRMKSLLKSARLEDIDTKIEVIPCVDLFKMFSLPTNAAYKYCEIFSFLIKDIHRMRHCFLLGNGLGGTSQTLTRMWKGRITLSTMLDPDLCIPQAYPYAGSTFRFSLVDNIDCATMVSATNDILNPNWSWSWARLLDQQADWCCSDIEISGKDNLKSRDVLFERLSALRLWKMGIIKDYIYSKQEYKDRLSIALRYYNKVQVLCCGTRQRVMPEVWWILERRKADPETSGMYYPHLEFDILWDHLHEALNLRDPLLPQIIGDINIRLATPESWNTMTGKIKIWATMPISGVLLPYQKTYTRMLGYLQRGKKPLNIQKDADDQGRKLYQSDYLRLREILFGLAVAMVGDINLRESMLNESEKWHLNWHVTGSTIWLPFLHKTDDEGEKIQVYDYIPILSNIMMKERLLFSKVESEICFKHEPKRSTLCYPITKAAWIRYTSMN